MTKKSSPRGKCGIIVVSVLLSMALALPAAQAAYQQTNLVADKLGLAAFTDGNLKNPWGLAYSATSPFWIANNGTGVATLFNTTGSGSIPNLAVTIPSGAPTGQVFNGNASAFNGDVFLFATENGAIAGWRGALGTTAETIKLQSPDNVYKGLAIGTTSGHSYLYGANFKTGAIDILKGDTLAPDLPSNFTDPNLPAGYAPFNIQNLGGDLYVAYALQAANKTDAVAGAGNGFVDKFDLNGNLLNRLITGGALNAPWGLAPAPASFGEFSGDLLVANHGDGLINAYDSNGNFQGVLKDTLGNPIYNEGLWGLIVGNGGTGGDPNLLYFTAGLDSGTHGLFGSLAPVPLPGTFLLLGSGLLALVVGRKRFFS